jgi:IS30 family transposase
MHMSYSHLTLDERYQISSLKAQKLPIAVIADKLKHHGSTILRELQRNTCSTGDYLASQAQNLCTARQKARRNAASSKAPTGLMQSITCAYHSHPNKSRAGFWQRKHYPSVRNTFIYTSTKAILTTQV